MIQDARRKHSTAAVTAPQIYETLKWKIKQALKEAILGRVCSMTNIWTNIQASEYLLITAL